MKTLSYDMKTMWDVNNDTLLLGIGAVTGDFVLRLSEEIQKTAAWQKLQAILPSDKLIAYFQSRLGKEIYPFVSQMMVLRQKKSKTPMWLPKSGIFTLLRDLWPKDEVPLKNDFKRELQFLWQRNRAAWGTGLKRKIKYWRSYFFSKSKTAAKTPVIAVRYSEGLDLTRRSDIAWFPQSGLKPEQVLICYSGSIKEKPQGMPMVSLSSWRPAKTAFTLLKEYRFWTLNSLERWVKEIAEDLLAEIGYWSDFYAEYNVKLFLLPEMGQPTSIAQGIAFDLVGGLSVGKQRSETGFPLKTYVSFHTKDLQFIWNKRMIDYLHPPINQVATAVIAGYLNDVIFSPVSQELTDLKNELNSNGAKFIVTLYDTGHGGETYFSSQDLEALYRVFLDWVLTDPTVGLVIKSKKDYIIATLPGIHKLLAQAEKTGRCLRLGNTFGRLASDASKIADFAVGYTVSSAVTEAVIAGCRGIHYQKAYPKQHDYYRWGLDQIVFNDLVGMMRELKKYKADPTSNPKLGNWAEYLDQLDPFRDGRGGERMGTYLRWCLEGFSAGRDREAVLEQANEKYTTAWGKDKFMTFKGGNT